jgi:peptidoglycan/LPS O-acetylase OafA/YrhL
LAVEEHFYLFLPAVLWLMMTFGPKFLIIALSCLAARLYTANLRPEMSHRVHYEPSHLRFDALFCGVFISYLYTFHRGLVVRLTGDQWRLPVSMASVAALAPVLFTLPETPFAYTWGFTLTYIAFGLLVLTAVAGPASRPGRGLRAVAGMGRYSYTIYLWHVPLAMVFAGIASKYAVEEHLLHAVCIACCITVGVALSRVVELPVLKIRDRLLPA